MHGQMIKVRIIFNMRLQHLYATKVFKYYKGSSIHAKVFYNTEKKKGILNQNK